MTSPSSPRARAEALIGVHLQLLDGVGLMVVDAKMVNELFDLLTEISRLRTTTRIHALALSIAVRIRAGLPPQPVPAAAPPPPPLGPPLCRWCGETLDEHAESRPPGAPVPRMPCLGLRSGFAGRST